MTSFVALIWLPMLAAGDISPLTRAAFRGMNASVVEQMKAAAAK